MARIDSFLRLVLDQGASDLHFHAGNPPIIRYNKDLIKLPFRTLSEDETIRFLMETMNDDQLQVFERDQQIDYAYRVEGFGRFRVNVFQKLHGIGAVFRVIPDKVPTIDEIGLPSVVRNLATLGSGLVLMTGPTGSGKTTTLAAIVNEINATQRRHIITIEDPIEYVHTDKLSVVTQRQIGDHAATFVSALRSALRESPDVIVVGELRDAESVALALSAAETGILVFGTLHTNSAGKAIDRLIDVSAEDIQEQVRNVVAVLLRAVVAQQLCRRAHEDGLIAACEVLMQNYAVSHMIREAKVHQIEGYLQHADRTTGSQSLDVCLYSYIRDGYITVDEALRVANRPDRLRKLVADLPDEL